MFDLAGTLFGNRRNSVAQGSTLTATGSTASTDGVAGIIIDADVTPAEGTGDEDVDQTVIDVPTSPSVAEGDEVIMTLVGDGPLKTPVVMANPGFGDRMQVQVDNAEALAEQAEAVVEQVRQDVADFRDDVATTYATKVERQDGDDAVRTFITTNYTNSNDLATTYATKTLVSQTKDAIELAASQTYETQSDASTTYATKAALTVGLDGIRSEVAEDYLKQSDASTTYATKTEVQQTASGLDTRITTAQNTADGAYLERTGSGTTIDTTGAATIRSLVVEGQSVQDGTPTPSAPVPIVSVEPRNLLPAYSATTVNGITFTVDGSGAVTANGTASATVNHYVLFTVPETGAYAMSGCPAGGSASTYQLWTYDTTTPRDQQLTDTGSGATGTLTKGHIISVRIRIQRGYTATNLTFRPMLELGTTAHPYQPYGCVTLVAGNTRTDIDLQGHALRSLPDGTHDEMRVDSLGRVTMTQRVGVTAQATTDGISATVGTDAMSTTGDLRDGATVIYPLATPQTIDLGTIDLPTPADTLWLDAALVPTIGATWWTVGGIAEQQALDAEVTERQTLIRQFSGGVLAGYVGNAIAALVNAAGSFDVVRTAWSGGVPSILGTLARYAASGISLFDAAGNVLAEFAADHVRIGGDVPIGDATTGGEASVQFFDQTSTHASSMDASTYIDEQAAGGGYGAYYDMRNEVGITTSLDDDGRVVDTDSSGTASMQLTQEMSYGITATDEQHNEVIAALVADASYSNGTAVSHAAVRATASTTGGSDLSYAELIADALGIGENEGAIDYFTMDAVRSAFPVTLYDNASASASAAATLSETAANFSRLTIFYKDNDGNHSSADVWQPDGKRVALAITWISGGSTQEMYQRVRWVAISGTAISTYKASSDAKYRTGQVRLGGTYSVTNGDYISIVHVIGWR